MAIFGKTDSAPEPSAAPERQGAAASPATVIGAGARFVGEITGDEDILIHGRFEGNVRVARRVTVASSGEVKGDIHGRSVVVAGGCTGRSTRTRARSCCLGLGAGKRQRSQGRHRRGGSTPGERGDVRAATPPPGPVQKKVEEQ